MQDQFEIELINQIGHRENMEDFLGFRPVNDSYVFLVCDGVGGSAKGEVASRLACESLLQFCETRVSALPTESEMQGAIDYAQSILDDHTGKYPDSKGMATTLALCAFYEESTALVAHVGDSRVYHVRNGKIVFKTTDHTYVNDLIKSGYITEEEAIVHPKRHVISRAIQGSGNQAVADIEYIRDVQPCDYFILCTDGILEAIDDKFIEENFLAENKLNEIVNQAREKCDNESQDNYTGIFIKIRPATETKRVPFLKRIYKGINNFLNS